MGGVMVGTVEGGNVGSIVTGAVVSGRCVPGSWFWRITGLVDSAGLTGGIGRALVCGGVGGIGGMGGIIAGIALSVLADMDENGKTAGA